MDQVRCTRCKVEKNVDLFISVRGKQLKQCDYCRNATLKYVKKCPHNRQKSTCKECGGASICEHNRRRSTCKECGGASICEHNRQKSKCKECGGASICEHNRQKSICKECGGASICEHNRQKIQCKECGGASICEHNRKKSTCKECGDAEMITIKQMIRSHKQSDIKYNRYNANHHIDYCFIKSLFDESMNCHYCDIEMQFSKYRSDMVTIERLDNSIGHSKSNCVLACRTCNFKRLSNNN